MNCLLLTLLVVIQIFPSLTTDVCEPPNTKQNTSSSSGSSPYCPCPLNTEIPILGYSPCSIFNYISPRECDVFIQVALRQSFVADILWRDDLPLYSNKCFSLFPFNENEVSTFNQT